MIRLFVPKKCMIFLLLSSILLSGFTGINAFSMDLDADEAAQIDLRKKAVRIFIDGSRRDQNYIKTKIPFVNYVRDRKQAQAHILITNQETGSGGREYTITFIGQNEFVNLKDTLKYVSKQTDTRDMIRSGLVRTLKMGLLPYVAKTPLAEYISIRYRQDKKPALVVDKWNNWVFGIDFETDMRGQESTKRTQLEGSISVDRVTPDWKISLYLNSEYRENKYDYEDYSYSSITRSRRFRGLVIKSLTDHWSVGIHGSSSSSTYSNNKLTIYATPAIEYNIFPYEESTHRELRFIYRLGFTHAKYNEETIYDKKSEIMFSENLSGTFEIKEKWGSISTTLAGSHYFHDVSKNRIELFSWLSLRLFEGFSLRLHGRASMIHDQLSLEKEGATEEELLLQRKQLATQYNYSFSIGFRYAFGSIYSNVVNPRFGN